MARLAEDIALREGDLQLLLGDDDLHAAFDDAVDRIRGLALLHDGSAVVEVDEVRTLDEQLEHVLRHFREEREQGEL